MNHTENRTRNGSVGVGTTTVAYTISGSDDQTGNNDRCHKSSSKPHSQYDPSQVRDESYGTNATGALLHLMKSSIGSGILAMSNAFKNGGLVFGLIGTVTIGILCAHCIYLLVVCSQTLCRRTRRPALGFADTAAAAFNTGPRCLRPWAMFASKFVNVALFCTYYFGNCVYVILISASFKQVADAHTSPEWQFSDRAWILGLALPLLPLGCIRSLRLIVPFSAIATTFILVGLGCTMMWVVVGSTPFSAHESVPLPDIWSRPWIAPVTQMPLFFTTVLFAMEGIGTVLPIENSMRYPQQFLTARPCGVLTAAMTLVVILYGASGYLGYLRFGDEIKGSITLNLPNDLFTEVVKIMVALSIIFSYGLQFCVPSEIAWNCLEPWLRKLRQNSMSSSNINDTSIVVEETVVGSTVPITTASSMTEMQSIQLDKFMDWAYYVIRATMILITFLIAAIEPRLELIISLFGAVFFSILGLLCPAIIHLATFWENNDQDNEHTEKREHSENLDSKNDLEFDRNGNAMFNNMSQEENHDNVQHKAYKEKRNSEKPSNNHYCLSRWGIAKDIGIVFIAIIALISGSYTSIKDIIEKHR